MRTASRPALRALPTATVATGTPAGIWTIDSRESIPSRYFSGTGTPITGSGVTDASMPGRWAAPPAPAMITRRPRAAAEAPYSIISCGIRWAETTSASYGTPNSSSASAAAFMTGQSESLPITTPTVTVPPSPGAWPRGRVRRVARPARSPRSVPQVVGRVARPFAYLVQVVAERGHVPDLAAWTDLLAVEVHLHARVVRHHVDVARIDLGIVAAEDVGHHRVRRGRPRVAQRKVEHRAQVLFELRGARALDRPVPGVVRAHGQLVDQHAVGGLEQLDREQAGDAEPVGHVQGEPLGLFGQIGIQAGRRRDHLVADAVTLHRLHDRVRRALTVRRPGHQGGQLAPERHVLLGQQRDPLRGRPLDHRAGLGGGLTDPHALAVVPAAYGLEHERPGAALLGLGGGRARREPRHRNAQLAQPLPHHPLVLGVQQRGG